MQCSETLRVDASEIIRGNRSPPTLSSFEEFPSISPESLNYGRSYADASDFTELFSRSRSRKQSSSTCSRTEINTSNQHKPKKRISFSDSSSSSLSNISSAQTFNNKHHSFSNINLSTIVDTLVTNLTPLFTSPKAIHELQNILNSLQSLLNNNVEQPSTHSS